MIGFCNLSAFALGTTQQAVDVGQILGTLRRRKGIEIIEAECMPDHVHTINVLAERKPTDVQLHCLIRMIEEGLPGRPTIDEVYESFETAMRAEEIIINQNR